MIFIFFPMMMALVTPFSHADDHCDLSLKTKWIQYHEDFNIDSESAAGHVPVDISYWGCPAEFNQNVKSLPILPQIQDDIVFAIQKYIALENQREIVRERVQALFQNLDLADLPLNLERLALKTISSHDSQKLVKQDLEIIFKHYQWPFPKPNPTHIELEKPNITYSLLNLVSIHAILKREVILVNTLKNLENLHFKNSAGTTPNFYSIAKARLGVSADPSAIPAPSPARTFYRESDDQFNGICSLGAIAHTTTRAAEEPNDLILCDAFYNKRTSEIERAATLIHEARHRDPRNPGHVQCNWGPYANQNNSIEDRCDIRLEGNGSKAGSSNNAEVYFLTYVAEEQDSNFPQVFNLSETIGMLQDFLNYRFVERITGLRYQKYLTSEYFRHFN